MNGTSLRSLSLAPHASFGWERGQSFQRPGRGRCHSASPPLEGEVTCGGIFFFFSSRRCTVKLYANRCKSAKVSDYPIDASTPR